MADAKVTDTSLNDAFREGAQEHSRGFLVVISEPGRATSTEHTPHLERALAAAKKYLANAPHGGTVTIHAISESTFPELPEEDDEIIDAEIVEET